MARRFGYDIEQLFAHDPGYGWQPQGRDEGRIVALGRVPIADVERG